MAPSSEQEKLDRDVSDVKEKVAAVDVVVLPVAGPAVIVVSGVCFAPAAWTRTVSARQRRARAALMRLLLPSARALQRALVFASALAVAFALVAAAAVVAAAAGVAKAGKSEQLSAITASRTRIGSLGISRSSSACGRSAELRRENWTFGRAGWPVDGNVRSSRS